MRRGARRLCPKAVGENNRTACHLRTTNRFAPGAEAGVTARSRKTASARRVALHILAKSPAIGSGAGVDRVRWDRRTANVLITGENGTGKKCRKKRTLHAFVHTATKPWDWSMREAVRGRFRKRTVWPCQRGLNRCARDRVGRVRARGWQHAVLDEIATVPLNLQEKTLCAFWRREISSALVLVHPARMLRVLAAYGKCRRECRGRRRAVPSRPYLGLKYHRDTVRRCATRQRGDDLLSAPFSKRIFAALPQKYLRIRHAAIQGSHEQAWKGNVREWIRDGNVEYSFRGPGRSCGSPRLARTSCWWNALKRRRWASTRVERYLLQRNSREARRKRQPGKPRPGT